MMKGPVLVSSWEHEFYALTVEREHKFYVLTVQKEHEFCALMVEKEHKFYALERQLLGQAPSVLVQRRWHNG
jgi:predicted DNA-binding WGR domain protein